MADNEKRAEMADRLERTLEASLEPVVDEILAAEHTETTSYEQECRRASELEEQAFADLQKKLEDLIDAVLERGETNIVIDIRETSETGSTLESCIGSHRSDHAG